MHVDQVRNQEYCNIAWSLAVMGHLNMSMFDTLLSRLSSKHQQLEKQYSGSSKVNQLGVRERYQVCQALAWLKPPEGSQEMEAWSSLRSRLHRLAPDPGPRTPTPPGLQELIAALTKH